MDINQCVIAGRLTRDPELKYSQSGTAVAAFTIAVGRPFKNQNGDREADFIGAIAYKGRAETIANHFKKGDEIGVVGRWQTRNYENNEGKRIYVNELIVESFSFGAKSSGNTQGNTNTPQSSQNSNTGQNRGFTRVDDDPFAGGQIDISNDDLPF